MAESGTKTTSQAYYYRYHIFASMYVIITSGTMLRIVRQPYHAAIKWEQLETVFKGTTLATAFAGFGLGGSINRRRSGEIAR